MSLRREEADWGKGAHIQTFSTHSQIVITVRSLDRDGNLRFTSVLDYYEKNGAVAMDQESDLVTAEPLPIYTLSIIANISLALGITNLLPIPALDGGRILFTLPELLFKKRIPQQWENVVNTVFFLLLIVLMVFITILDFTNPVVIP